MSRVFPKPQTKALQFMKKNQIYNVTIIIVNEMLTLF